MQLNCIVDHKSYTSKPKGYEIPNISNRLDMSKQSTLSIDELKEELEQGKTYIAGHFKDRSIGREKNNMKDMNFFSLDVDNHYMVNKEDVYTNYTIEQAIDKVESLLNITPILSYITFSKENINGSKRFRLIYGIDSYTQSGDVATILKYISSMSGDIFDKSAVDESRLFFSTDQEVIKYNDYKLLDPFIIDELKELMQIEEKEEISKVYERERNKQYRANTSFTDDVIEEIKKIDIADYLVDAGYTNIKKTSNGYKMPCPIHKGTNDNFTISNINGISLWVCFSKCNRAGGTIIDLHMQLNNLDVGQAIQELKQMYNIKAIQDTERAKESYTIEKYISKDKQATESILRAVQDYNKVLLTGSMGTGKTHFILNDLYKYSKEIDKVLILIEPNVSQLSNLNKNKDIPIVCETMPVYMGNSIVATTPESLKKITKEVGKDNYILVVDESHERYTSSSYRRGYRDKSIEQAESKAYKSIHLTATPRLLGFDKFDKEINIKSKSVITNNITIVKVKDKIDDNILSIASRQINAGKKPIIFNNNIDHNNILKEHLEKIENVLVKEYKEGQLNLLELDDPLETIKENILISAETVRSGEIPESIAGGNIDADVTITTSSIQAGIDLYTDDKAVLIINTQNGLIDNLIQLIGRFRKGIEVIFIIKEEDKRKQFDLEYIINLSLRDAKDLADTLNNNSEEEKKHIDLIDAGLKENANLTKEDDNWIVDKYKVVRKVYEEWSKAVLSDADSFISVLKMQDAFKIKDVKVKHYYDELETRVQDAKKISREERKEKIEKAKSIMLDLPDDDLYNALTREYKKLDDDVAGVVKEYFQIAETHLKKIRKTRDELYTDAVGLRDSVGAFRHFYSSKWADIKRDIKQKQVIDVNKLIEKQGKDHLLSRQALRYKTSIDVVQAKIRNELQDLEKKQGRLSNKRVEELRDLLVAEGFIRNKYTKMLENEPEQKDREKALKCLGDIVRAELGYIYNFKGSGETPLISSIKL